MTQASDSVHEDLARRSVHAMIEHLVRTPGERGCLRSGQTEALFERFAIPAAARPVLKDGGRDQLHALGIHPNLVIKWLIWSGRPTMKLFRIGHYFDRR